MRRIRKDVLAKYPRPLQGNVGVLGSYSSGSLSSEYQNALNRANQKNEQRYQDILKGYDDLQGRVMGDLENVGITERQDIDRQFKNLGSDTYQRLVNRGFGNSTIPATMQMGIERERSSSRGRLASQLAQQRANYDTAISQGKMGVMERRQDVGPDINQMIALSQGLGRGGYGFGMGMNQPIGIPPSQYQNMYQNALARHFAYTPFQGGYQPSMNEMQRRRLARAHWAKKNQGGNSFDFSKLFNWKRKRTPEISGPAQIEALLDATKGVIQS